MQTSKTPPAKLLEPQKSGLSKIISHPKFFPALCILTLALGFIFRLYYTHITPYNISVHDTGGHVSYIKYIVKNKSIHTYDPVKAPWAYYNPPFYHLTAAVLLRFFMGLGIPEVNAWELLHYYPCVVIFVTTVGMYKILKQFDIKGLPLWLGTVLISFHPTLNYLSVTINNDPLSLMLTVWAIYFAVKWFKQPTTKSIVGVALCIGLGMMTKLSVALIAPPVAILFLVRFIKDKQYIPQLKQFGIFSAICFPLGLFWSVRNWWLFKTPITYVQSLPITTGQYVGEYTSWQRFGLPPFSDFTRVDSSWSRGTADHNLWSQTLRTALFDDNMLKWQDAYDANGVLTTDIPGTLPASLYTNLGSVLMVITVVLAILMVGLTAVALFKAKQVSPWLRTFVGVAGVILSLYFVKFCLDFPFTCTIHFRYIVPLLLYGCIGMGLYWSSCKKDIADRILMGVASAGVISTALISTFLYLNCLTLPIAA